MSLPSTQAEIIAERTRIESRLKQLEAEKLRLEGEMKAIQSLCTHPDKEKWHTNPLGRWPTNHEQCKICGYYREV